MLNNNSIALLISTYNWPQALEMVLESVLKQKKNPTEILIADDGSDNSTKELIDAYRQKFSIPVKHFWHEDQGFRKTVIMNEAIAGTNCEYIIQIDGDILLHPYFIADHASEAEKGFYIKGSRAMLSQSKTIKILQQKSFKSNGFQKGVTNRMNALRVPALSFLFYKISKRSDNLRGCNCAFWKEDFVKVNGYNNNLFGWGHEDIELAARFVNSGLFQKQLKMKAVCFHMYHQYNNRNQELTNLEAYQDVVDSKIVTCLNGYEQVNR